MRTILNWNTGRGFSAWKRVNSAAGGLFSLWVDSLQLTGRIELDGGTNSHWSRKSMYLCEKWFCLSLSVFVCFALLARSKFHLICRFFVRLAWFFFFLANFRWCFYHSFEKRNIHKGQNEDWSNENTYIHSKKHVSPG